jgi:hypothetical protein
MREHDCSPPDYAVVIDVIHVTAAHFNTGCTACALSIEPSPCSPRCRRLMLLQVLYAIVWEQEDPHFCSTYTAWCASPPLFLHPQSRIK